MKTEQNIKDEIERCNEELKFCKNKCDFFNKTGNNNAYNYYLNQEDTWQKRISALEWVLDSNQ